MIDIMRKICKNPDKYAVEELLCFPRRCFGSRQTWLIKTGNFKSETVLSANTKVVFTIATRFQPLY